MKYISLLLIFLVTPLVVIGQNKPTIYVLATGGTIAGSGTSETSSAYTAGGLTAEQLIQAVPAIDKIANIKSEQITNIGSQDMSQEIWLQLTNRINELSKNSDITGFVITHGTDTQDETAYFLNLTLKTDKPVVLTGAMRPSNTLSADGPRNLFNAVACAVSPTSKAKGVMIVMDDFILGADDIQKSHTLKMGSFSNPNFGPLGIMYNEQPMFFRQSLKKHTTESIFDIKNIKELPKVAILMGYADADDIFIKAALEHQIKGIVYAGVGNGNMSTKVTNTLSKAVQDRKLSVVRSSRLPLGPTTQWDEIDDDKLGFATSWFLSPQKARILLMLALTQTNDYREIQKYFTEY